MTHPAATPPTAEQIAQIIDSNSVVIVKGERVLNPGRNIAPLILAALAPAERASPLAERAFVNELGNQIKITIEGPASISENTLTSIEAEHLRDVLTASLGVPAIIKQRMETDEAARQIAETRADTAEARLAMLAPAERAEAAPNDLRYACDLAVALASKFYPEVTQWRPLDTVQGLLSQIDNMSTGLVRAPTRAGALDAAGAIEAARNRLVEAVEAWGDGHDAGRVYNAHQSAVMKALNAYLDAKAALAAGDGGQ